MNDERHREEIRRLVAAAPDEPTHCEFKEALFHGSPKQKGELVKDVSSFANTDLEALGGFGYVIFGVADDGRVVGIAESADDPSSSARQIVNGYLGRSVAFEYLTSEVEDRAGGVKRVAAIVVPDSRRRPHVAAREIKQHMNGKDKFWLRKGEVWVRKTGGRELATADDIDVMYESKLRLLIEERVRPLRGRIEELERDLRQQRSAVPEIGFGFAVSPYDQPSPHGELFPILGNLIGAGGVRGEMEWAKDRSRDAREAEGRPSGSSISSSFGFSIGQTEPDAAAYDKYEHELRTWLAALEDLRVVDFALSNTGRVPAEDVEVVLEVPAKLRPKTGGLEWPLEPRDPLSYGMGRLTASDTPSFIISKPDTPDFLAAPDIYDAGIRAMARARWEVGKLHHDRPMFTHSDGRGVSGLIISASGYQELRSKAGGLQLAYTARAANLPEAQRGLITLV